MVTEKGKVELSHVIPPSWEVTPPLCALDPAFPVRGGASPRSQAGLHSCFPTFCGDLLFAFDELEEWTTATCPSVCFREMWSRRRFRLYILAWCTLGSSLCVFGFIHSYYNKDLVVYASRGEWRRPRIDFIYMCRNLWCISGCSVLEHLFIINRISGCSFSMMYPVLAGGGCYRLISQSRFHQMWAQAPWPMIEHDGLSQE